MKRPFHTPFAAMALAVGLAFSLPGHAADNPYGTIDPGEIKVAVMAYMPYTATKGGEIIGLDSDILKSIAKKLNLNIKASVTDFPGMLAAVQTRRVDIAIGGIAWSPDRQKQGLFTDPPYYSPLIMGVKMGESLPTTKSLEGKTLGTVTGYVYVKAIKDVPNAKLRTYPNAIGVFEDLSSGRLDAGFLDPLLVAYQHTERPDLKFNVAYLQSPTKEELKLHPGFQYFEPFMTGFYIPKQEPKLEKAISEQIDAMYKNGEMKALITKWGGKPDQFLVPTADMAAERTAVDRPAGWTPPTIAK